MALFKMYLRQRRRGLAVGAVFCTVFIISFALFQIPVKAAAYPALICAVGGAVYILVDFRRIKKKHRQLQDMQRLSASTIEYFPEADRVEEEDYQQLIRLLCRECKQTETELSARIFDMEEYYAVWAHQIKTPIASMRLSLQNKDSALSRRLESDLLRIEHYVEMVLMYVRLDSKSTDYVISRCSLDGIICRALRRFSGEFIQKRLSLGYEPVETEVITDEKWLGFVIEQVLSNALKYTDKGGITVTLEPDMTLCIRDTGMGIAPEDLPRIFQKGYTGYNGRGDKRSSGIGLYLCRRVCDNLGHSIRAESKPGQGTSIYIGLGREQLETE